MVFLLFRRRGNECGVKSDGMGSAYDGTLFLRSSIRIQERKEKGVGLVGYPGQHTAPPCSKVILSSWQERKPCPDTCSALSVIRKMLGIQHPVHNQLRHSWGSFKSIHECHNVRAPLHVLESHRQAVWGLGC